MRFGLPQRSRLHETEERAYAALVGAVLTIAAFGFLPVTVVMVVGLVQGTSEGDAFMPNDAYPAFTVLSPLMAVPVILLAVSFVMTFHLPLKDLQGLNRSEIMYVAIVGFSVHMTSMILDQNFLSIGVARFVAVVLALYLVVLVAVPLRIVAGWLRLVPDTWRNESARKALTRSRAKAKRRSSR